MPGRITELVFRANNRSAIRALDEIATRSEKTGKQVNKDSRTASSGFDRMGSSAKRLRGSVTGLAGVVGAGGLAFGIKSVVQAGESWQKQQTQLQGALKNTGAYSKSTSDQLSNLAEGLATRGGFAAGQNLQALTRFITVTGSQSKAQRDLALTTNIARQSGFEFMRVQRAIMMLEAGRTTGLARLGIAIPKVTTAQDALRSGTLNAKDKILQLEASGVKLTTAQKAQLALTNQVTPAMLAQAKATDAISSRQQALTQLQAKYSGATDRFSKSTAGRISNMRNAWDNLQKAIGTALIPVMNRLIGVVAGLVSWLGKHKIVLYLVLGAIAALSGAMVFNSIVTTIATTKQILFGTATAGSTVAGWASVSAMEGMTVASAALAVAMDAIPLLAIITGIVLLITHWKQVKIAALDAWKWIKVAATDTWNWIKGHWPLLAGILLAPFTGGISLIVGLFHKQLWGAIKSVIHWITGAWKVLKDIITWPFREAWKIIKAIIGWIKGAINSVLAPIKSVVNFVGGAFSGSVDTRSVGRRTAAGRAIPHRAAGGIIPGSGNADNTLVYTTPGEGVVNNAGMRILGTRGLNMLNQGSAPTSAGGEFLPITNVVQVDGKAIYKSSVRYALQRAARGPSSNVGGALATGSVSRG